MHPLVGHQDARSALARARSRGTLPAALLVMGPRGVGKQRLALWLAQVVLCAEPGPDGGCGSCRNCRRVLRLEHPDLHWFFPVARPKGVSPEKLGQALEEARHERLAELREAPLHSSYTDESVAIYLAAAQELRRKARSRPAESGEQIFIIADAETLVPQESSPEAANALLKLLEEPPPDTRFILTSSEPGRLLDTIRSRTVPLHLSPPSVDEAAAFLAARGHDPEAASQAARLAGGSIGMALGFLPGEDGELGPLEEQRRASLSLLRAALAEGPGNGYALVLDPEFTKRPEMKKARLLVPLLDFLDIWIRDLAAITSGAPDQVVNRDALTFLQKTAQSRNLHAAAVSEAVRVVEEARREARGNVTPVLVIAGLVSRLQRALLASPLNPSPIPART
ncbi:MAG TPA: DNA polymerase III subunit delta' [Longimicrobiales bacterium]|nr:DNA polymerase III subunit delta' [Longimicrobiales bacterium]